MGENLHTITLGKPIRNRYIWEMNTEDQKTGIETDLLNLEKKVDELVAFISALQEENRTLRVRQKSLNSERAELIEKTELARIRVESMITRLKSMEAGQ